MNEKIIHTAPHAVCKTFIHNLTRIPHRKKIKTHIPSPSMMLKIVCCCLLFSSPLLSWNFTQSDLNDIGMFVWQQECLGCVEGLLLWDAENNVLSLGIGHFMWGPQETKTSPQTQFFNFIQFVKDCSPSTPIPSWITPLCPWSSQTEIFSSTNTAKLNELRHFLLKTLALQVQFLLHQFATIESQLIAENPEIKEQLYWLKKSKAGHFAIVDYCTFQGSGLAGQKGLRRPQGLLQVLKSMEEVTSPEEAIAQFVLQAKKSLQKKEARLGLHDQNKTTNKWYTRINHYLDIDVKPKFNQ